MAVDIHDVDLEWISFDIDSTISETEYKLWKTSSDDLDTKIENSSRRSAALFDDDCLMIKEKLQIAELIHSLDEEYASLRRKQSISRFDRSFSVTEEMFLTSKKRRINDTLRSFHNKQARSKFNHYYARIERKQLEERKKKRCEGRSSIIANLKAFKIKHQLLIERYGLVLMQ